MSHPLNSFIRLLLLRGRLTPVTLTTSALLYALSATWPNTAYDRRSGSTQALQPSSKKYMSRYVAPPQLPPPQQPPDTSSSAAAGPAHHHPLANDRVAAAQFATLAAHFGVTNRTAFLDDWGSSLTEGMGQEALERWEDEDDDNEDNENGSETEIKIDKHQTASWMPRGWRADAADIVINGAIWAQAVALGDFGAGGWRWPRQMLYEARARARRRLDAIFVQVSGDGCGDVQGEEGRRLWVDRGEQGGQQPGARMAGGEGEEDEGDEDEDEGGFPGNYQNMMKVDTEDYQDEHGNYDDVDDADDNDDHDDHDDGQDSTNPDDQGPARKDGTRTTPPSSSSNPVPAPKLYTLHHWLTANGHEREMRPAEVAAGLRARTEPVLITWKHNERFLHIAFAPRQSPGEAWWSLARIWDTDDFGDEHVEAALSLRNPVYVQIETDSRPWAKVLIDMT